MRFQIPHWVISILDVLENDDLKKGFIQMAYARVEKEIGSH